MPHLKDWDNRYREKGLTVIGVHSPEFDEERNVETLRSQVSSLGIRYPVVSDNDYQTWNAYKVEAWPTVFLLDKQGRIRWMRVGEGNYEEAERLILKLLAEKETPMTNAARPNLDAYFTRARPTYVLAQAGELTNKSASVKCDFGWCSPWRQDVLEAKSMHDLIIIGRRISTDPNR